MLATAQGQGQDKDKDKVIKRFNIIADLTKYPQDTPEKALGSVVNALGNREVDYLLAHLAEPKFIDFRVATLAKEIAAKVNDENKLLLAFDRLLKETQEHFTDDPTRDIVI